MLRPLSFLCNADLSIPINFAIFDIFPPNFLSCVVKYSFSKFSLASFKGIDKVLSEDDLYKLELDSFMRLIETKQTQDRIKHTLSTGKPLVN